MSTVGANAVSLGKDFRVQVQGLEEDVKYEYMKYVDQEWEKLSRSGCPDLWVFLRMFRASPQCRPLGYEAFKATHYQDGPEKSPSPVSTPVNSREPSPPTTRSSQEWYQGCLPHPFLCAGEPSCKEPAVAPASEAVNMQSSAQ